MPRKIHPLGSDIHEGPWRCGLVLGMSAKDVISEFQFEVAEDILRTRINVPSNGISMVPEPFPAFLVDRSRIVSMPRNCYCDECAFFGFLEN